MRLRALLAIAAAGALALPAAASAAGELDAELSQAAAWPKREIVLSLPEKRVLNTELVSVSENGDDVNGLRVISQASNRRRGIVLVIDASLTMRGQPMRSALVAARRFAARRGPNTPMGVIFFSDAPTVALRPTTDAAAIRKALAVQPELTRGTRIYDAAGAGVTTLRRAGMTSGAVVVLSDGAEAIDGSATTVAGLTAKARSGRARVFSVGLASRSFDSASLKAIAAATGGRYGEAARPEDLPGIFAAIGDRLSTEYVLAYRSTVPAGSAISVQARVAGVTDPVRLDYRAPQVAFGGLDGRSGGPTASRGLSDDRITLLGIGGFLLGLLVLYVLLRPRPRSLIARVSDFHGAIVTAPTMADVVAADERRTKRKRDPSSRWSRFEETVELSDVGVRPLALAWGTGIATVVLAWYLVASGPFALIVFAAAVPFAVRTWVTSRLRKRRQAFEQQLPDNLQVLASALRAGYSFSAALASMAKDAPEPSRSELTRVSSDEQIGMEISEALRASGERMASPEIEYVGIVARMQREVGGNTAEVLDQVIETIRDRAQLKRAVRVLTAQGRIGGIFISAAPLVVGLALALLNPGYFDPMFESGLGTLLFIAACLMVVSGWMVIRKIIDVEA